MKLTLDDQLCFALYAATNAVTRAYRPLLAQLDITYPQYLVMLVLWQDGPSTVGAIASRLSLASSAITPLIDQLERGEFVKRTRSENDRRVVHVSLTERGAGLERNAAAVQAEVACRTGLGEDAYDVLRESLVALTRDVTANAAAAPARERVEEPAGDGGGSVPA